MDFSITTQTPPWALPAISEPETSLELDGLTREDVNQLREQNRKLHSDNIKKTVSLIDLENDFFALKDEMAMLKKENESQLAQKEVLIQQLSLKLTVSQENCADLHCVVAKLRRQLEVYQKKYDYFEDIISKTNQRLQSLHLTDSADYFDNDDEGSNYLMMGMPRVDGWMKNNIQ